MGRTRQDPESRQAKRKKGKKGRNPIGWGGVCRANDARLAARSPSPVSKTSAAEALFDHNSGMNASGDASVQRISKNKASLPRKSKERGKGGCWPGKSTGKGSRGRFESGARPRARGTVNRAGACRGQGSTGWGVAGNSCWLAGWLWPSSVPDPITPRHAQSFHRRGET